MKDEISVDTGTMVDVDLLIREIYWKIKVQVHKQYGDYRQSVENLAIHAGVGIDSGELVGYLIDVDRFQLMPYPVLLRILIDLGIEVNLNGAI